MIPKLIREQLRSQWRFTVWTAGLLALGLLLATFAMVRTATQIKADDAHRDVSGFIRDQTMEVYSFPPGEPLPADAAYLPVVLPFETLDPMLDDAAREGAVTIARHFTDELLLGGPYYGNISAFMTPVQWSDYLVEGRAPGHGETVLSVELAARGGWSIGDTVEFGIDPYDDVTMTLEVVGLSRSGGGTYLSAIPAAFISWDDSVAAASVMPQAAYPNPDTGAMTYPTVTTISWDGDNAALPIDGPGVWGGGQRGFSFGRIGNTPGNGTSFLLLLSALALLGVIIVAFATGRAQAEARTKWIATARVLGVTRRTIAASSILETAVIGVAATIVGLGVGYLAAFLDLIVLRMRTPQAMLPDAISLPAAIVFVGILVGILFPIVVAAVPAYRAARISPVAALKPVAPLAERKAPRKVRLLWLVILMAGVVLDALVSGVSGENTGPVQLALIAAVIVGFTLLVESLPKLLRFIGTRLARGKSPWAIAAGDGLVTHTRMYTFASLSMVVVVGSFAAMLTGSALGAIDWSRYRGWGEPPMLPFGAWITQNSGEFWLMLMATLLLAMVVALAITLSSERAGATETATRAALGLSHSDERAAAGLRQIIPMAMGIAVGGLLGWVVPLVVRLAQAAVSPEVLVHSLGWNLSVAGEALLATTLVVGIALALSLACALTVALSSRPQTPVEALHPAGKVRAR